MYVIAVYDISTYNKSGQRRLSKVMKIFRMYLHHVQKSVFEGETSEAKFKALQANLKDVINKESDYIIFYRIDNKNNLVRESLGHDYDPNDTII